MRRKIISIILTVALVLALTPAAFAADGEVGSLDNFEKVYTYSPGQFSDVNDSDWFYESVKAGYEYGLIKGNADGTFNVGGSITIAETLALACRLNNIYYGGDAKFVQGEPWYQVYVEYATENGIISDGEYPYCEKAATRAEFASILAKSIPDKEFNAINNISTIPDVSSDASYFAEVLKLYRAGILTGSDVYGTFNPDSNIVRTEVAAIVTRIADRSLRIGTSIDSGDFAEIAGVYTTGNNDTLYIDADGSVEISIYRLTTMEGTVKSIYKGIVPIAAEDANGNEMGLEFLIETGELIVTDSVWDYLENGETFVFSKVSTDFSSAAGTYITDNGDSLIIDTEGNVEISIIRLASMEGYATGIVKGIIPVTVIDPSEHLMRLEFAPETGELIVVNSTWDYLPNGETFILTKVMG